MSDDDMTRVVDSSKDIRERWKIAEPYWRVAESTGYGRSLSIAARDLYGIDRIDATTIEKLNQLFQDARSRGGHYDFVFKNKSGISLVIRDKTKRDNAHYRETDEYDLFAFAIKIDDFIYPTHYLEMRQKGREVGMEVHTLADWIEVTRRYIEKYLNGHTKFICLKCLLAYWRSLRFDKVTQSDAEKAFNEFFDDGNLPDRRPPIKAAKAFSDWMMHFICRVADDNRLAFQIHMGLQEGNDNFIYDSNPVLLSNLFLEYRNVRFDIFHMGYPYIMELGVLAKNFRNVFIDMCWGHIISPEAARRTLVEWLDAVPANKISAFGGDYLFVDGVYGHQYLARQNVARALAQKVTDGSFSLERAKEIASWVFFENPKRLFGLERLL
jgi:hypothetical protein